MTTSELAQAAVEKFTSGNDIPVSSATISLEEFKAAVVEFYYYWHNQPGTNTIHGLDEWIGDMT